MKTVLLLWFAAWYSNVTVTEYVDGIESLLVANRDNYLRSTRTQEQQAAALADFEREWAYVKSPPMRGEKVLGALGKACIADRSLNGQWSWEKYCLVDCARLRRSKPGSPF